MTTYNIPIINEAQRFTIVLAGVSYDCLIVWNEATVCWQMDFIDSQTGAVVLSSVPLIPNIDLFGQFKYLGFGGQLIMVSEDVPTYDNLGVDNTLTFVTA